MLFLTAERLAFRLSSSAFSSGGFKGKGGFYSCKRALCEARAKADTSMIMSVGAPFAETRNKRIQRINSSLVLKTKALQTEESNDPIVFRTPPMNEISELAEMRMPKISHPPSTTSPPLFPLLPPSHLPQPSYEPNPPTHCLPQKDTRRYGKT